MRESRVPLLDLVMALSEAVDLVSPLVADHHKRVAYIAFSIAAEMGLPSEARNDILVAGALHDIGALSLGARLDALQFELEHAYEHAEAGGLLLQGFEPFARVATLVRYHHHHWDGGQGAVAGGEQVPVGSHILHLADRVSVLIEREEGILQQVPGICQRIQGSAGKLFVPEMVLAFGKLAERECFWLDAVSPGITTILAQKSGVTAVELNTDALRDLARLFARIIDFRSPFTATHSSGVAACAEILSRLAGLSEIECKMMSIAGYLHDLGKLAVPAEVLEKPASLTEEEFSIMRAHTYYTYRILSNIEELAEINAWASCHHERLDGGGYPFHYTGEELRLGQRIMAVSDVFAAITADRPYRKGMEKGRAQQVLRQMAGSALDPRIVSLLLDHFDEVNSARMATEAAAAQEYREFGGGAT